MRNEIMRLALGAHRGREGVVAYANLENVSDWPHPEIHAGVVEVLDALARFPHAVTHEIPREKLKVRVPGQLKQGRVKALRKLLLPALLEGWSLSTPDMIGNWQFLGEETDASDNAWINGIYSGLDTRRGFNTDDLKHWPECLIVIGLWRMLDLIGSGLSILTVKRCAGCSTFFLDGSRGQRGKYCGGTCRVRAFRSRS